MPQSKALLQAIASGKLEDAKLLYAHGRFSNAYYLGGYAIEIALKACVTLQIQAETLPDRRFIADIYTHEFEKLIGLAGLRAELRSRQNDDVQFQANWGLVNEWKPDTRYDSIDRTSAQLLLMATADEHHGILPWITTFW